MTNQKLFLHKLVNNYLHSGYVFDKNENLLKFQFEFINLVLSLAIIFSPFIAYLHKDLSIVLFYSDNLFSLSSFILALVLRIKKENFRIVSMLFVLSLYVTITLVFFLIGNDPTKVIWAPIFFACAFLLLGSAYGIFWLFAILASYALGYLLLGEENIYYSWQELSLIGIAFTTVSLIFNAFRRKNDSDNQTLLEINAELQGKKDELESLNLGLEQRIENALRESQNKTKSIQRYLDIINQHIIIANIDLYGLITNVSEAYCKISGYGKTHFISQPFTKLFNQTTSTQELKEIWKKLQNEEDYIAEVRNENSKEQSYWLSMHIAAEYTANHEHIGYIVISHDVTDKKLVIQQQEQLISQSRHAAMGEMISMIAHQWRQPLSTISAIASSVSFDISLNQSNLESVEKQMQKIGHQVQHLSSTIDDFRDFFKPTKGLENTYVHKLVEEALKLLDHRLVTSNIRLIHHNSIDISLQLYRNELIQVLINVFNNAYDALTQMQINDPYIKINEYLQDDYAVIEISDNAGGIDESILKRIFDPYFSTKTKNGTGLGLYMSKTIVEDHQKGHIEAFNDNEGAVFKISLPLVS